MKLFSTIKCFYPMANMLKTIKQNESYYLKCHFLLILLKSCYRRKLLDTVANCFINLTAERDKQIHFSILKTKTKIKTKKRGQFSLILLKG